MIGTMGKSLSLAFAVCTAICMLAGCADPTPQGKLAVGNIARMDVYDQLDRYPVKFDHDRHGTALGKDGCVRCHSLFDDKAGENLFHRPDFSADEMTDRMHQVCIICHRNLATEGKNTGPQNCGGCHEKRDVPAWTETVIFDHDVHGENCGSCHHVWSESRKKTIYSEGEEDACISCHGDEPEGEVKTLLREASHKSCFGCHRTENAKNKKSAPVQCAGCHKP